MQSFISLEDSEPIEIRKYMGDWNVIANIPTFYERNAYNSVEGYRLNADGTIFNFFDSMRGSFDGPKKRIQAKAWVFNAQTNKEWKVQFFWPLKFAYQILECDRQYRYTVVGHPSKKVVWIMAREKQLDDALLASIITRIAVRGYDVSKIRKAPQRSVVGAPTKISKRAG